MPSQRRNGASARTAPLPTQQAQLLALGCVVRVYQQGVRISIRDREDDDLLLTALSEKAPPKLG